MAILLESPNDVSVSKRELLFDSSAIAVDWLANESSPRDSESSRDWSCDVVDFKEAPAKGRSGTSSTSEENETNMLMQIVAEI